MYGFQLLLSEPSAGVLELSLIGEVDLGNVEKLREASQTAARSGEYTCLVFDLTRLEFIDSSGLHVLAQARSLMVARGGTAKLVCPQDSLLKVLELTGLKQIFPIAGTRDEAIAVAA
jgi:anti-anti-sigma factor